MNYHKDVTCDACLKENFRGYRYKCLVCVNYDLCSQCYEQQVATGQHTPDHPVQCILTNADFLLHYGGEMNTGFQAESYTCPYCGRMGFTINILQEHVYSEHPDTSMKLICPVCATRIEGDANIRTDAIAAHLAVVHSTDCEPTYPSSQAAELMTMSNRSAGGAFSSANNSVAARPRLHLTTHNHIPFQLQMQLERERQQLAMLHASRQQMEKSSRQQTATFSSLCSSALTNGANSLKQLANSSTQDENHQQSYGDQFLLSAIIEEPLTEEQQENIDRLRANRSIFLQEILVATAQTTEDNEPDNKSKKASKMPGNEVVKE